MNRKYVFTLALLVLLGISSLPADVAFSIRYYDKRIYYLEQDPILVQVTLTNNGPLPFRFKLADDRAFSVDFDVRTTANLKVAEADVLVRRRSGSQQVYFREVSIEAEESFSFVEDIRAFASLTESGAYVVRARLYPELYQSAGRRDFEAASGNGGNSNAVVPGAALAAAGVPLESNRLTLSLRRRPVPGPDGVVQELDVETNAVLKRQKLPPDEVVSYLLTARQKQQWEKFFLYMDIEAMLARDAYRRRQWNASSEEGRDQMAARYREDLRNSVIDRDISLIPKRFVIEHTSYNEQTGTVVVMQYFDSDDGSFTQKKRYTWELEKKDGFWTVVSYSVSNQGIE